MIWHTCHFQTISCFGRKNRKYVSCAYTCTLLPYAQVTCIREYGELRFAIFPDKTTKVFKSFLWTVLYIQIIWTYFAKYGEKSFCQESHTISRSVNFRLRCFASAIFLTNLTNIFFQMRNMFEIFKCVLRLGILQQKNLSNFTFCTEKPDLVSESESESWIWNCRSSRAWN